MADTQRICDFPECGKEHEARGFCAGHYRQLKKGKTLQPLKVVTPRTDCSFPSCDRKHLSRGYCSGHYAQVNRGDPLTALRPQAKHGTPIRERLDRYTDKSGDCWIWTGATDRPLGYGRITVEGRLELVHRVSYKLHNGHIPAGMMVDHICHNRSCIRPEHLRTVTNKQNQENRRGASARSSTGVLGVRFKSGKWEANVIHNQRALYLGRFLTLDEAADAVRAKRLELYTHNDHDRT